MTVVTIFDHQACVSVQQAYWLKDWRRLLLSPLHHADDWHLYFNMASFLMKGIRLERRLGGTWFLYLLSVFSLLTGLVYLALEATLTELMQDQSYSMECAVGFSGTTHEDACYLAVTTIPFLKVQLTVSCWIWRFVASRCLLFVTRHLLCLVMKTRP